MCSTWMVANVQNSPARTATRGQLQFHPFLGFTQYAILCRALRAAAARLARWWPTAIGQVRFFGDFVLSRASLARVVYALGSMIRSGWSGPTRGSMGLIVGYSFCQWRKAGRGKGTSIARFSLIAVHDGLQ